MGEFGEVSGKCHVVGYVFLYANGYTDWQYLERRVVGETIDECAQRVMESENVFGGNIVGIQILRFDGEPENLLYLNEMKGEFEDFKNDTRQREKQWDGWVCKYHPGQAVEVRGNSFYCALCRCAPGEIVLQEKVDWEF